MGRTICCSTLTGFHLLIQLNWNHVHVPAWDVVLKPKHLFRCHWSGNEMSNYWCFNPMDKWGTLLFGRWLFLTYWCWESIKPWIIAIEPFRWWPPEQSHFLRTQNLFFKCNHCINGIHDSCFHFDYVCLLCRMWQWQVTMKPYKTRMRNKKFAT